MKFTYFLISAIVLAASSASATESSLKIMHTGGKTGSTSVIASEYSNTFKKTFSKVEVVGPGGCVPVISQLRSDKTPTLVIWDTGMLPDENCRNVLTKQPPVATYGVYFALCTKAGLNLGLTDFLQSESRVALSTPFAYWRNWYQEVSSSLGTKFTPVPVGDSGKLVLSLISRETDWALLNGHRAYAQMKDNKLNCVATTNPDGENGLPYIGNFIIGFDRSTVLLGWGVYVANATDDQRAAIETELINIHQSLEFRKFAKKSNIIDHTNSADYVKEKFVTDTIRIMSGQ